MPSAYQPVPNTAEVKMTYRQGTNLMSNTYHVLKSSAWTQEELVSLSDVFYDWENLDGKGERSTSIELTHITAADLTSQDAPYMARAIDPAVGGIQASQALPLNVTLAIAAVTGTRGRGRQGRIFHIGLCEDQVDENVVTNTSQDNIVDDLNSLLTAVNAVAGQTMVVVHRYRDGVKLATATTTPIEVWAIRDTTVDTQKVRLPNHRRASARTLEDLCAEVVRRGGTCTI
jgi:hypothetical protein